MKIKGLFFITIIVFLFIITGISYTEENLIINPSFEELSADDKPLNWRTHSWIKDTSTVQFGTDMVITYSGNNSVLSNSKNIFSRTIAEPSSIFFRPSTNSSLTIFGSIKVTVPFDRQLLSSEATYV